MPADRTLVRILYKSIPSQLGLITVCICSIPVNILVVPRPSPGAMMTNDTVKLIPANLCVPLRAAVSKEEG